ncbi:uncharacterized protein (DUF1499 family) [Litorimonas taeanensis]|uniref:Uncharacterized protein (DUF1499 family) n=1 Tax=Litorimonas taeanensis TaxID=568099 RepID=A0A420WIH4_9PROT|nr:DUF1499 domain-containing protein [Litorimonas taeanensis]RKQ70739.1 uncharacterized protein (DUF1499 family) [Litorimonas taeanensis]
MMTISAKLFSVNASPNLLNLVIGRMVLLKFILFIGLFIAGAFILMGIFSQKGKAKGLINGRLADVPSTPNAVSSEGDTQPERRVAPLEASLLQVAAAIEATGGVITSRTDDYISATYMSRIFKFIDDVEVREENENLCHIRSASRVGYSDRGVNRRRVAVIRSAL